MRKDSRLSFRISNILSKRIDEAITSTGDQIRDRSEFGTKAIMFYLDYIENTQSEAEVMLKSIISLADHVGVNTEEINKIREMVSRQKLIPTSLTGVKTIDLHPKFDELMELRDKFSEDVQKEISDALRDATYSEIDELLTTYEKKFYLEGTELRPREEKKIRN